MAQALNAVGQLSAVREAAIRFFVSRQNPDGGFGDELSTTYDTALVLQVLIDLEALDRIRSDDASGYLFTRQDRSGSWDGSVYSTALVLATLNRFSFPNWSIESLTSNHSGSLRDGERVEITLTIRNDSSVAAPATTVLIYDGDPDSGGVLIGEALAVPALLSSQQVELSLFWDTYDLAGEHTLVAVLDAANNQVESSESDNRFALDLFVEAAPATADLTIIDNDITVIPANPISLPVDLSFAATVSNLGMADATDVLLQLRADSPEGEVLDEQVVSVAGRNSIATNFNFTKTTAGNCSRPLSHRSLSHIIHRRICQKLNGFTTI